MKFIVGFEKCGRIDALQKIAPLLSQIRSMVLPESSNCITPITDENNQCNGAVINCVRVAGKDIDEVVSFVVGTIERLGLEALDTVIDDNSEYGLKKVSEGKYIVQNLTKHHLICHTGSP